MALGTTRLHMTLHTLLPFGARQSTVAGKPVAAVIELRYCGQRHLLQIGVAAATAGLGELRLVHVTLGACSHKNGRHRQAV